MNIEDAARITWGDAPALIRGSESPWEELPFDEEREWTEWTKLLCARRKIDLNDMELTEEKLLDRLLLLPAWARSIANLPNC